MNRHWHARLGDHCNFLNGGTPSKANPANWGGDIPWITSADISDGVVLGHRSKITREGLRNSATNVAPPGTILLVSRTGVGKVAQAPIALAFSQDITAVVPKSDAIDARYLLRFLETRRSEFERNARGATIKGITRNLISSQELSLPPLDEQRRIAAALDKADELRQTCKRSIALLDSLTQSIFLQMFGDPIQNTREFPVAPLEQVVSAERPIRYGILMPGDNVPDGVPYVRVVDIQRGRILVNQLRRTSAEIDNEYRRSKLLRGDLLISIRGHVGRTAIVPPDAEGGNITQDTARLAVVGAEARYVMAALTTESAQHWMFQRTKGAAVRGINLGDLRKFPMPLPPRSDQEKFAASTQAIEQLLDDKHAALELSEQTFASLQHRAFSGQL